MNTLSLKRKFRRGGTWLLFLSAGVVARGSESERFYSLTEVAAIDRENKMLRRVDATESVETNVQRLLAAGFPAADVEELKPRLVAIWGEIDPLLQIDWLDPKTLARIQELKSEYTIPMRRARLDEETYRLGGEHAPITPYEVKARWRSAIRQLLLRLDEREEFDLMNSASALALYKLTKDVPMTVAERRELCELQQDFYRIKSMPAFNRRGIAERQEAWLVHWQIKRDLLGDDRFAVYLRAANTEFGRMAGVLDQIGGVNNSKALELWWIRKEAELAKMQMSRDPWRFPLKDEAYKSATAILGSETLGIYEKNEDGKWLERLRPFRRSNAGMISLKASGLERK